MSTKFLIVFFLSLLNASQGILNRKNKDNHIENNNKHPPATAKEMEALLQERARRRAQEETVDTDGTTPDKGDKMISRNGDVKIDGDEIELSFMIVSFLLCIVKLEDTVITD